MQTPRQLLPRPLRRGRAWRTNLLIVVQAVLFVLLTWAVDKGVTASRQRQPAFRSEAQARLGPTWPALGACPGGTWPAISSTT